MSLLYSNVKRITIGKLVIFDKKIANIIFSKKRKITRTSLVIVRTKIRIISILFIFNTNYLLQYRLFVHVILYHYFFHQLGSFHCSRVQTLVAHLM